MSTHRQQLQKTVLGICLFGVLGICCVTVDHPIAEHVRSFLKEPANVGALMPCSDEVGKEITRWLRGRFRQSSLKILEVGAGNGTITNHIVQQMRTGDQLDVIEIDEAFCAGLRKKFGGKPGVNIRKLSITDWKPAYQYDIIISTLPFNNFDIDMLRSITEQYEQLIKPGGILSYVEYLLGAETKTMLSWGGKKREYQERTVFIHDFRDRNLFKTTKIYKNFPPISVHHLRIN